MHTPMEWIRGRSIGHGSFAKVSLARPTTQNSHLPPLIAVKSCSSSQCTSLMNEFMILDELKDCPEILNCYGDSFTVENGEKLYNVALEYASGGSLAEKVKNSENSRLSESDVRRYTKSILKGLEFIHRKGVVHCDIKLQNVLLFAGDKVKIADFGLAKRTTVESEEFKSAYEIRGTPMYMAPETVTSGEQKSASDVWAVGCLVTEMLTGKPAWGCSDIGPLFMKIGIGAEIPDIPGKLSEAGKDFLGKCFEKDRSKRWTAEMLLKHPFIDGEDRITSTSPRNPFDFPDWETEQMITATSYSLPDSKLEYWDRWETRVSTVRRLQELVTDVVVLDWSVSGSWITVR